MDVASRRTEAILDVVLGLTIIVILVTALTIAAAGCSTPPDQNTIREIQQSTNLLDQEIARVRALLIEERDPVKRAALEAELDNLQQWSGRLHAALDATEDGDFWGALGEAALWIGSGFFPPLVAGIPIFRTLRRQRTNIFRSIDAGGGPINRENAKRVLTSDVAAYKAFQAYKAKRDPSLFVGNDGAVL